MTTVTKSTTRRRLCVWKWVYGVCVGGCGGVGVWVWGVGCVCGCGCVWVHVECVWGVKCECVCGCVGFLGVVGCLCYADRVC